MSTTSPLLASVVEELGKLCTSAYFYTANFPERGVYALITAYCVVLTLIYATCKLSRASVIETDAYYSPENQKILEEEFQRNPRPDKATRLDIVSRVTLGEKEVQIWFQNRRQNSRKKSKV